MKLSLDLIVPKLPYPVLAQRRSETPVRVIQDIRFAGEEQTLTPNHLYIGRADDFRRYEKIPEQISILCLGELPQRADERYAYAAGDAGDSLISLFNRLQDVFLLFNNWERTLHSLLERQAALNEFLDASAEIIGYPLDVIDVAESTLAVTKTGDPGDVVWREVCEGFVHADTLSNDSIKAERIIQNSVPVEYYSTVSRRNLLTMAVRIQRHVVGFLSAHMPQEGETSFGRDTIQLLSFLERFIAWRMNEDDFHRLSRGWVFEYILLELIEGRLVDSEDIRGREQMLTFSTDGPKKIFVFTPRGRTADDLELDHLRAQLETMYRSFHGIIYQGSVVAIDLEASIAAKHSSDPLFIKWLLTNDLDCSVSNFYTELSDTSIYYTQALKARFYGGTLNPKKRIHYYWDCALEHSFEIIAGQMDLRSLIHPTMKGILMQLKSTPFLLETLRSYLRNERNISQSAQELFVHKNTMNYRVNVLREKMAGCDLDSYDDRSRLLYSIDILEYMERFMGYDLMTDTFAPGAPVAAHSLQAEPQEQIIPEDAAFPGARME